MIIGKVARILNESELILNVGRLDDVKWGMEFVIYSESEHVLDPETGEDLGAIETVKGRVKTTHVMEEMSRAKTSTYQVAVPSPYSVEAIGRSIFGQRTETRRYKLQVHQDDVMPIDEDLTVRIGDKVRSVE